MTAGYALSFHVEAEARRVLDEIFGHQNNTSSAATLAPLLRARRPHTDHLTSPTQSSPQPLQQFHCSTAMTAPRLHTSSQHPPLIPHTIIVCVPRRIFFMPTDRTGENPLWNSSEPYYDDFYAISDLRTSGPLLTIIAPRRESDIVRALVDIYRHEGWLPDARSGNYTGRTQGGSNAEFLITDAFMKGLKGVDWNTALSAEIHDAEIPAGRQPEGGPRRTQRLAQTRLCFSRRL